MIVVADDAFRALREASLAMETAKTASATSAKAHADAIGAALRANRAAIDLLDQFENPAQ